MPIRRRVLDIVVAAVTCAGCFLLAGGAARAHCDTYAGPVIREAMAALDRGDVTPVLKWVTPEHEATIRSAFAKTLAVRAKGADAKDLADRYFLETLVRLHRAGEGEPYTGIKDEPPEAIVAMADKSLADGSADPMIQAINAHAAAAIKERLGRVLEAAKSRDSSVAAGRRYVEAYVQYMHFVEGLHAAIAAAGGHGHAEGAESGHAHP